MVFDSSLVFGSSAVILDLDLDLDLDFGPGFGLSFWKVPWDQVTMVFF